MMKEIQEENPLEIIIDHSDLHSFEVETNDSDTLFFSNMEIFFFLSLNENEMGEDIPTIPPDIL